MKEVDPMVPVETARRRLARLSAGGPSGDGASGPFSWALEERDGALQVTLTAPGRPVDSVMTALRRVQEALEDVPGVRRLCVTWVPGETRNREKGRESR